MKRIVAPGKLVLVGEYAVLDGAPAIVAAVNRGVVCEVTEGDGIETPGDDRFVRAALEGAPRAHYRFYDQLPVALPGKAGFGGSAAATVAAVRAAGRPDADAYAVHAAVQGGGSGIDVFASLRGGVRVFPSGEEVACPHLFAIWSGTSASTGSRVEQYRRWSGREEFVVRSTALVERFRTDPIGAVEEAYPLLVAMSREAGIDYDLPAFRRIAELARAFGGAAKPSGAGGGDVAVAVMPDAGKREALARAVAEEGFVGIEVRVAG